MIHFSLPLVIIYAARESESADDGRGGRAEIEGAPGEDGPVYPPARCHHRQGVFQGEIHEARVEELARERQTILSLFLLSLSISLYSLFLLALSIYFSLSSLSLSLSLLSISLYLLLSLFLSLISLFLTFFPSLPSLPSLLSSLPTLPPARCGSS